MKKLLAPTYELQADKLSAWMELNKKTSFQLIPPLIIINSI